MKSTIQDIAKACGVSIACVSRILNEDSTLRVRPEVRERVLKEVEVRGYIPNYYARQLANGPARSKTDIRIGYVTYRGAEHKMNTYFDRVVEGIVMALSDAGYEVLPYTVEEVCKFYERKEPLAERKLDGLVLFGNMPQKIISYLSEQAKYLSSIYGDNIENADFVGSDLRTTLNVMLDYIAKCGYDEIGFVTGNDEDRNKAILAYAEKLGLHIDERYFFSAAYSMATAYELVKEKVKTAPPPKVICCMNDEMAIGVMNALLDSGIRIPEDVCVTGHDDILKSNYSRVPLTTVRIFKEEIGRLVADILLERINYRRAFPIKVFIPCKLIVRKSLIKRSKQENV